MRQALAAGACALLIATSSAIAKADQISQAATINYSDTASTGVDAQAVSPDVAAWTSHLVIAAPRRERGGFGRFAGSILARTSRMARQLTKSALRFLGTPYVFGGSTPSGFDCSAYVQHVFAMFGIFLPRTADAQYSVGRPAVGGPRPGDLVFFETYAYGPSHVGIYLGNGEFVHASSSRGVMVSSLSEAYWSSRYIGAKRLLASAR